MNIIISIHNIWAEKILKGEKTIEFRNNLPKNLKPGDKVFIYETYKNNGRKMVVGSFTLSKAYKISNKGRIGFVAFIRYYVENILKDKELLKLIDRCEKISMPHHYQDIVYSYMYCDEILDYMEKHHDVPELDLALYMDKTFLQKKAKAEMLTTDCDDWLTNIGFYNEFGESHYLYAFEIEHVEPFINPIPITEFVNQNMENIKTAPQSWCYTLTN
jgi:hypothetical protein